jgi:hypothetical protein
MRHNLRKFNYICGKLNKVLIKKILTKKLLDYYEGRSESKERFAIQRYLLKIGKKQNKQVYHTPSPTSSHRHLGH